MYIEFDNFYKISSRCLVTTGAHPGLPRDYRWAIRFLLMQGYYTLCFLFFAYNMIFIDVKVLNDFTKASGHGIFLVVYLVVTFCYLLLLWYQDEIKGIIALQQDFFDSTGTLSAEDHKIVYDYASRGRWVSKLWLISTIITLTMFPVKGCLQTIYEYSTHQGNLTFYPFVENYYPFGIDEIKQRIDIFALIYVMHLLYASYAVLMYSGFSPLGPIFILNACAQVELLTNKVYQLFDHKREFNREEVEEKLKTIVIKTQEIYKFVEKINSVFKVVYELFLKASAVLIPVSLFLIIKLLERGEIGLDYIMFIYTALLLCFVPCFYSDLLMEKGELLRIAIYSCGWEHFYDKGTRATLLVMLTRATRPLSIHALFRVVCLDAFADLCHQSYALFSVMNAALD